MPTGTTSDPIHHSFAAPPFENATVVDAMRIGVVSCPGHADTRGGPDHGHISDPLRGRGRGG